MKATRVRLRPAYTSLSTVAGTKKKNMIPSSLCCLVDPAGCSYFITVMKHVWIVACLDPAPRYAHEKKIKIIPVKLGEEYPPQPPGRAGQQQNARILKEAGQRLR